MEPQIRENREACSTGQRSGVTLLAVDRQKGKNHSQQASQRHRRRPETSLHSAATFDLRARQEPLLDATSSFLPCGVGGFKREREFLLGLRTNCCGCAIHRANASAIAFSLERRRFARSPWNCQCKSAGSLTVVLIVELELIRPGYSSLASFTKMQTPDGA